MQGELEKGVQASFLFAYCGRQEDDETGQKDMEIQMSQLTVETHFDAAHTLRGYRGKCEHLHGQRFKVVARVRARKLTR